MQFIQTEKHVAFRGRPLGGNLVCLGDLVELAPVDGILFVGKDALVEVVKFEEGGDGLFGLVVEVEGDLEYLGDVADHVDGFDFDESALVDIEVEELRKAIERYLLFVVVAEAVILNDKLTVEVVVIGLCFVAVLVVAEQAQH